MKILFQNTYFESRTSFQSTSKKIWVFYVVVLLT